MGVRHGMFKNRRTLENATLQKNSCKFKSYPEDEDLISYSPITPCFTAPAELEEGALKDPCYGQVAWETLRAFFQNILTKPPKT